MVRRPIFAGGVRFRDRKEDQILLPDDNTLIASQGISKACGNTFQNRKLVRTELIRLTPEMVVTAWATSRN